MALTADRIDTRHQQVNSEKVFPVAADAIIYLGASVCFNADGYLVPADDDAEQEDKPTFQALEAVDNTGGDDGDKECRCITDGTILAGNDETDPVTQADVGKPAHFIADDVVANTSTNSRGSGVITELTPSGLVAIKIGGF
jgi:hypothetical protein